MPSEHLVELNLKIYVSEIWSVSAPFRWHRHLIVPSAHTSQSQSVLCLSIPPFSALAASSALVQELVLNWAAHWLLPAVKILSVPQGSDVDGLALLHQSNPQYNFLMKGATNTKHSRDQFRKCFRYCVKSAISGFDTPGEWVHTAYYSVWCYKSRM